MFENLRAVLNVSENLLSALSYKRQIALDTIASFELSEGEHSDWENSDYREAKEILVQLEIIEKALSKHMRESM